MRAYMRIFNVLTHVQKNELATEFFIAYMQSYVAYELINTDMETQSSAHVRWQANAY